MDDGIEEVDGIAEVDGIEEVDGIPVLADVHPIELRRESLLPVPVQAAAVAVGGFLAGVLTIVLFRRRRLGHGGKRRPPRRRGRQQAGANVVASRSFLVDVHLLGGRE